MSNVIKIIRLKNGEDIVSEIEEQKDKIILTNPMSIIFKTNRH